MLIFTVNINVSFFKYLFFLLCSIPIINFVQSNCIASTSSLVSPSIVKYKIYFYSLHLSKHFINSLY